MNQTSLIIWAGRGKRPAASGLLIAAQRRKDEVISMRSVQYLQVGRGADPAAVRSRGEKRVVAVV